MSIANNFRIDLISETMVRPNEATEGGTLFLSNIDHLLMFYNHTVYVYPHRPEAERRNEVEILRNALAKLLVTFDFMAGRLKMNDEEKRLEVECNNAGVLFSHSETKLSIEDMGTLDFLNPFLPILTADLEISTDKQISDCPLMIVKVTKFNCGGFVVGMSIIHALLDGHSGDFFLSQFASAARGEGLTAHPYLHKATLRARNPPRPTYDHPELVKIYDLLASSVNADQSDASNDTSSRFQAVHVPEKRWKIFSFTTKLVDYLRKKSLEDKNLRKCSQFEALTAYIWQARTKALDMDPDHISQLMFAVDFRQKFDPPLPKELIGNCVVSACVKVSAKKLTDNPLSFGVKQIQDAASQISEAYVRSSIDWLQIHKGAISASGGIIVSSWSRFSFLRMNLGWGEPAYSGPIFHGDQVKHYALLLPNKQQGSAAGMDVCLALDEQQMHKFTQIYQNLCEFAELDTNPMLDMVKTSKL